MPLQPPSWLAFNALERRGRPHEVGEVFKPVVSRESVKEELEGRVFVAPRIKAAEGVHEVIHLRGS